jgi:hypothetical protein
LKEYEVVVMSEYDVSELEVEDQSEDGVITKSPHKHSPLQLSKDDIAFRYVSKVSRPCESKHTCTVFLRRTVFFVRSLIIRYLQYVGRRRCG